MCPIVSWQQRAALKLHCLVHKKGGQLKIAEDNVRTRAMRKLCTSQPNVYDLPNYQLTFLSPRRHPCHEVGGDDKIKALV